MFLRPVHPGGQHYSSYCLLELTEGPTFVEYFRFNKNITCPYRFKFPNFNKMWPTLMNSKPF